MLKKLRLSGVLQTLELRTRQAVDGNLAHSEFLYRLLAGEVERRDAKQLDQRVRRANFEHAKTIEDFDFVFNPAVPKAKILDLATCNLVAAQRERAPRRPHRRRQVPPTWPRPSATGRAAPAAWSSTSAPTTSSPRSEPPGGTAPTTAGCSASPRPTW